MLEWALSKMRGWGRKVPRVGNVRRCWMVEEGADPDMAFKIENQFAARKSPTGSSGKNVVATNAVANEEQLSDQTPDENFSSLEGYQDALYSAVKGLVQRELARDKAHAEPSEASLHPKDHPEILARKAGLLTENDLLRQDSILEELTLGAQDFPALSNPCFPPFQLVGQTG